MTNNTIAHEKHTKYLILILYANRQTTIFDYVLVLDLCYIVDSP